MPNLVVIGGPNGAGKSTTALEIIPNSLNIKEFINADAIAKGLSPYNINDVKIQAGKIMLHRMHELAAKNIDFALESTLSSRSLAKFLIQCRQNGYHVALLYFWLNDIALAIQRVKNRVDSGGHDIPVDIIKRRYRKSKLNLLNIYLPVSDSWTIFDNSANNPVIVAEGEHLLSKNVYLKDIWMQISQND